MFRRSLIESDGNLSEVKETLLDVVLNLEIFALIVQKDNLPHPSIQIEREQLGLKNAHRFKQLLWDLTGQGDIIIEEHELYDEYTFIHCKGIVELINELQKLGIGVKEVG